MNDRTISGMILSFKKWKFLIPDQMFYPGRLVLKMIADFLYMPIDHLGFSQCTHCVATEV